MPVVIAASVDEALIRSSAGRHEASWRAGLAGGWRAEGPLAILAEVDLSHRAEDSGLLDLQSTEGRAALLVEGHLGARAEPFKFVVGAGPGAALVWTKLNAYNATSLLFGARAEVGGDATLRPKKPRDSDGWTVGFRIGAFASERGVDLDLGVRTGWVF